MTYCEQLERELNRVGIRGRLQRRILAEFADHLSCDAAAELGPPAMVADRFADELGTVRARRAGYATFAALAVAGGLFAAAFLAAGFVAGPFPRLHTPSRPLADLGLGLVALGGQLSFVTGLLALLWSWRHRHQQVVAKSESVVLGRRAAIALLSAAACLAGLVLLAIECRHALPGWWTTLALGAAAGGGLALAVAAPRAAAALRLRPVSAGTRGDLFDDLGPLVPRLIRGRHWLLALGVACAVGLAVVVAGVGQSDPYDGVARGVVEALACLGGFALLGPYLGLLPAVSSA